MTERPTGATDVRVARLAAFDEPVTAVRFVDAPRAELLSRLGVHTVEDLLRHYPSRWLDLRETAPLGALPTGFEVTAVGIVHEVTVKRPKPRLTITEVAIVDDTGVLIGVWFNQPYLAQRFKPGDRVAFAGKVQREYGMRQMRNPFVERLGTSDEASMLGRILPVHPATEGLSTNWMRRLVLEALDQYGDVPDFLPAAIRSRRGLYPLGPALRAIHFPPDEEARAAARRRLAYDELLAIQLGMALRRHAVVDERAGHAHVASGAHVAALLAALPFELTGDQRTASGEIAGDMVAPRPMNRMLLGDVGSGKTVVAAIALARAADSGTQAAMMAPTEVLARQYAASVGPLLDAAGVSWRLLTGSTPAAERRDTLAGVASGAVSVLLGTHALLTGSVSFRHLTLAIVDEQHRFGVDQRLGLRAKGEAADMLVMTATPIPRSLALTLYGDLDTSYLRERPGGRGPDHVSTRLVPRSGRAEAYDAVRSAVAGGRQAYVVCALVDESDASEAKAAVKEAERLRAKEFPDLRVGLLTGQMKPADKIAAMRSFRAGDDRRPGRDDRHRSRRGRPERHGHDRRGRREIRAGPAPPAARPHRAGRARRRPAALRRPEDVRGEGPHAGHRLDRRRLRARRERPAPPRGGPAARRAAARHAGVAPCHRCITDTDLLDAAREDAAAIVSEDPHLKAATHAPLLEATKRAFGRDWEWVSSG